MFIVQFAAGKRPASLDANEAHLPTKRRGEDGMTLSTAFQASPRLGFDDCAAWAGWQHLQSRFGEEGQS